MYYETIKSNLGPMCITFFLPWGHGCTGTVILQIKRHHQGIQFCTNIMFLLCWGEERRVFICRLPLSLSPSPPSLPPSPSFLPPSSLPRAPSWLAWTLTPLPLPPRQPLAWYLIGFAKLMSWGVIIYIQRTKNVACCRGEIFMHTLLLCAAFLPPTTLF